MFPVGLAWVVYIAAQEELDFFSFPMVLQSVVEDVAIFAGLKQQLIFIPIIDRSASPFRGRGIQLADNTHTHTEQMVVISMLQFRRILPIPVERA